MDDLLREFMEIEDRYEKARENLEEEGGKILRAWRKKHRIGPSKLARELEVDRTIIWRIETGKMRLYRPLMERLLKYMEEVRRGVVSKGLEPPGKVKRR